MMIMDLMAFHRVDWKALDRGERAWWAAWYALRYNGKGGSHE